PDQTPQCSPHPNPDGARCQTRSQPLGVANGAPSGDMVLVWRTPLSFSAARGVGGATRVGALNTTTDRQPKFFKNATLAACLRAASRPSQIMWPPRANG